MKKSTKKEFIIKAKIIHRDLYDYSLFEYNSSRSIGTIICEHN